MDNTAIKFVPSKMIPALMIFLLLGLIINTALSYSQTSSLNATSEQRIEFGNEVLEMTKEQNKQIEVLLEKLASIESKLDSLDKSKIGE